MDWIIPFMTFGFGIAIGILSTKRGATGAGLGVLATILAFIGLS